MLLHNSFQIWIRVRESW